MKKNLKSSKNKNQVPTTIAVVEANRLLMRVDRVIIRVALDPVEVIVAVEAVVVAAVAVLAAIKVLKMEKVITLRNRKLMFDSS
jgi:hypothetical protein